jgi:hypothetical protein
MSSLKLKTPSGGSVSFNAEDTGTDYTLTVPAGNSTIITASNPPASLSTATGSAPSYSARAWVNFNGTGTVAIRDSGNVSSITDNGTGDYTVNFTAAMADADYAAVCTGENDLGTARNVPGVVNYHTYASSSLRVLTSGSSSSALDFEIVNLTIFS